MGSTPPGHTLPGSPPVELQERLARAMEPLMIRTPKEEPSTPTPAGPANPSPSSSSVSTPPQSSLDYSTPAQARYVYISPSPDSLHGPSPPPKYTLPPAYSLIDPFPLHPDDTRR